MGAAFGYRKSSDLPALIPVFPLSGAVLFPRAHLPLNIFEPRYLNMVDDTLSGSRLIGMVQTAGGDPARPELHRVGCVGRLTRFAETDDGRYLVTLTGVCRFRIAREIPVKTPYRQVQPDWAPFAGDLAAPRSFLSLDRAGLERALRRYLDARGLSADWSSIEGSDVEPLINGLSAMCPFDPVERQSLLEAASLEDRAAALIALLTIDAQSRGDDDGRPPMQ